MKLETANLLVKAADEMGIEMELRPNYFGSGMMGDWTDGVVFRDAKSLVAAAAMAGRLGGRGCESLADEMNALNIDNMGHDLIAY
jgi:hypothetical protein